MHGEPADSILPPPLVKIATSDPASNARNAAIAAILELLKAWMHNSNFYFEMRQVGQEPTNPKGHELEGIVIISLVLIAEVFSRKISPGKIVE